MLSLHKGTEAEWWSMFSINPEKDLSMALEFSFVKITFAAVLSVIIAYFINGFLWRKEK
jgi:hypothetical protein